MGRVIAVANQKGGVGKTTTCVNLTAALALAGKRVLLIDLDPQGNATVGCGLDRDQVEFTIEDVLMGRCRVADAAVEAPEAGFSVIAANANLTAAELALLDQTDREQRLRHALQAAVEDYDYILIDCPPSLNILTVNALVASDGVLVPVQCEYYALEGLTSLLDTIARVRERANPRLRVQGLVRTMYSSQTRLSNQVSAQLLEHFPKQVYATQIPRLVRLSEAPSHGRSIIQYDRYSRGALAYVALAAELTSKDQLDGWGRRAGEARQHG
jgi:chromosome partitioning protein